MNGSAVMDAVTVFAYTGVGCIILGLLAVLITSLRSAGKDSRIEDTREYGEACQDNRHNQCNGDAVIWFGEYSFLTDCECACHIKEKT
jgi:hypothetical protein